MTYLLIYLLSGVICFLPYLSVCPAYNCLPIYDLCIYLLFCIYLLLLSAFFPTCLAYNYLLIYDLSIYQELYAFSSIRSYMLSSLSLFPSGLLNYLPVYDLFTYLDLWQIRTWKVRLVWSGTACYIMPTSSCLASLSYSQEIRIAFPQERSADATDSRSHCQ